MCNTLNISKSGYYNWLKFGIIYIKTKQVWLYLAVIINLYNRKIVEWSVNKNLSTEETIVPVWNMAILSNKITDYLIFHLDGGSQYASQIFTNIIKSCKGIVIQSMSRKGNCWDNVVTQSFFKSLKVEWVYKQ